MILTILKYCMVLNSTMCYTMEIVPIDHKTTSVIECAMGGMMMNTSEFTPNGIRYKTAGVICREVYSDVQTWLRDQK